VSNAITEAILGAWGDDEEAPEGQAGDVEPVATTTDEPGAEEETPPVEPEEEEVEAAPAEEEEEGPAESEEGEEEEPSEEEEAEEAPGDEEEESAPSVSDDPGVQAFLARTGSVEQALKKAVSLEQLVGRQGRELGELRQRNVQLEGELEQVQLFSQGARYLSEEQKTWLEEAVGSDQPVAYIQSAVEAGEFDLARAVLEQGEFSPYQALRMAQGIDAAEGRTAEPEVVALDHQALMGVLIEHYPEMPRFEQEMVATLQGLGVDHPLAALARSQDPAEAAQGVIGLYEIARAKTATVASTRESVKTKSRQAAAAARSRAVVTSGEATPPQAQTPRPRRLMPGLTLEALEAEFAAE
jgi:hypothetical protein